MKLFFKLTYIAAFLTAVIVVFFGSCSPDKEAKGYTANNVSLAKNSDVEIKITMRKLWQDHIIWTRNYILCEVDGLPGKDEVLKRLMENQVQIGNAIKPYYGEEAGKKLTELLFVHINVAGEVIKAANSGNTHLLGDANTRWHANADDISEFLCKANPNWSLPNMKMMMKNHLELTAEETVQRIKKNYKADVFAFDKIHHDILLMADILANGISLHFPEKNNTIAVN